MSPHFTRIEKKIGLVSSVPWGHLWTLTTLFPSTQGTVRGGGEHRGFKASLEQGAYVQNSFGIHTVSLSYPQHPPFTGIHTLPGHFAVLAENVGAGCLRCFSVLFCFFPWEISVSLWIFSYTVFIFLDFRDSHKYGFSNVLTYSHSYFIKFYL